MSAVEQVQPIWTLAAVGLVFFAALCGVTVDGVLEARARRAPVGWLVPWAEAARLLRQRRRTLVSADRLLWRIGVVGLPLLAVLMAAVLPFGHWVVADLPVGLVWFNAMDVMAWALVWMAGWGPNAAYPLVGGYRFLALALAYELPLMFALTGPAVAAGSLRMGDIVAAQEGLWFVVWMPVAFVVFCAGVLAFSLQRPFDAPVGTDLAGGVLAELSGLDRLLFQAGRYALLAVGAGFGAALFLGGGAGPALPEWAWFSVKSLLLLTVLLAVRRRLPTVRPDRLMGLAWTVALPAILFQLLIVSIIVMERS